MSELINPMDCTITAGRLCSLLKSQAKSAQLWIDLYERHKDEGSIRNAALAIGKVNGIFNVLHSMGIELPEDILVIQHRMSEMWSKLGVK